MSPPLWILVGLCGLVNQVLKLTIYSLVNRRVEPPVLAQGYGMPSLQAAVLGCLVTAVVLRGGWWTGEASFALVFAVVAIHDILKLRSAFTAQREAVYRLVHVWDAGAPWRQQVAGYLDPLRHHPAHVAVGVMFGALFALAFGFASR